jgi:hypothetical protein
VLEQDPDNVTKTGGASDGGGREATRLRAIDLGDPSTKERNPVLIFLVLAGSSEST